MLISESGILSVFRIILVDYDIRVEMGLSYNGFCVWIVIVNK